MTLVLRETIFALASAVGKAGVAVFRVSGPNAFDAISRMTRLNNVEKKKMNVASIYSTPEKSSNCLIDKGMVVSFEGPNSFTGEDVVEFHVHGSIAVMNQMLRTFNSIDGFRLAERGEFCKRAWMNNKMDLVEVESLTDLIDSKTEIQRKLALNQMNTNCWTKWTEQLTEALALIEAVIDFSEDASLESGIREKVAKSIQNLLLRMTQFLENSKQRVFIRDGFRVTIAGPTNAGKSSFMNLVAKKKVSIVSPIPGTTRDLVRINVDLDGYPVEFCDTAGFRATSTVVDPVELEGIELATEASKDCQLVLFVIDASSNFQLPTAEFGPPERLFVVANKIDKLTEEEVEQLKQKLTGRKYFLVSCLNNSGIEAVCGSISKVISSHFPPDDEHALVLNQRQFGHLECCVQNLNLFLQLIDIESEVAVAAEYLRMALESIGNVTGHVNTEQVLDVIFNRFCIGK